MIHHIVAQDASHCVSTLCFQPYALTQLLEMLPDRGSIYQKQLNSFSSDHRKREWIAVRVLLYILLGETKEISYRESGEPYMADHSWQISISHTRGHVAIILSKDKRVGIDIEVISDRAMKVARKFVDETELIYPETHQITRAGMLTLIWSAKETMYKCMDSRVILFREQLHVDVNVPLFDQPYLRAYETHTTQKEQFNIYYIIEPSAYVLTYALKAM